MPGVGFEPDTPKFQYIPSLLGIGHPPGYPLYMLLGYLWSLLPFPALAYGMNLLSAVFAVGALLAFDDILERLEINPWVAFPTVIATGLTFRFWSFAVVAEVYTLHMFILTMLFRAVMDFGKTATQRSYLKILFWTGCAFSHHLLILTALPGVVLYILHSDNQLLHRKWFWKYTLPLPFIVLGFYFLLCLKNMVAPIYVEDQANTLPGFVDLILARNYQSAMFIFGWEDLIKRRFPYFAEIFLQEWPFIAWCVFILGIGSLYLRKKWEALMLALAVFGNFAFAVQYSITDIDVYVLPSCFLAGAFVAEGWSTILRGFTGFDSWRAWSRRGAMLCFPLLLIAWFLHSNEPWHERHEYTKRTHEYTALIEALPDDSLLIANDFYEEHYVRSFLYGDPRFEDRRIKVTSCDTKYEALLAAYKNGTPFETRGQYLNLQEYDLYAASEFSGLENAGFILEPIELPDSLAFTQNLKNAIANIGNDQLVLFACIAPEMQRELRRTFMENVSGLGIQGFLAEAGHAYAAVGAPWLGKSDGIERANEDDIRISLRAGDYLGWKKLYCWFEIEADTKASEHGKVIFETPLKIRTYGSGKLHALVVDRFTGRICDIWHIPLHEPFPTHHIELRKIIGLRDVESVEAPNE